ncbi:sugar phosphate nucleotidyltransferase [Hwanghaeella sp.]|uniref:sugar phosphate nucleotidyltransferase n=1 Tax=Hwanghaeella sp. TaxID=2605943 RepID=UPI003CCB814E
MLRITDTEPYTCRRDTPLRTILERINATDLLCQLVVDDDGRLAGTVTDGDIRRGLLHGLTLDALAEECMFTAFKFGLSYDPDGIKDQLFDKGRPVNFLPVLDDQSRLVEIVSLNRQTGAGIEQALIMAGGFGTRLGELTKNTPKPLVEVAGKPIMERVLLALEEAGIDRTDVAVHYRADQIRTYVDKRSNKASISLIEESEPLGTAGALALLHETPKAPALVMNADVVTDIDFAALHQFYLRHDYDAVVCVSPYSFDIPFGVVEFDEAGGFRGIHEKPKFTRHIAAGVYYLSPEIFALVRKGERIDMPDVLERAHELGMKIGVFPIHEYWIDLGGPADINTFANDR